MKHFFHILVILICCICFKSQSYNVAFHAQVFPTEEKVVGSVITTDGLVEAFRRRHHVESTKVFYPSKYKDYHLIRWDFLIIEGWFPSLVEFIQLSRNLFPDIVIMFYCLDPSYPGLDKVFQFDVDGIITNSAVVYQQLLDIRIPTAFMMLAADPHIMKPNISVTKDFGAVYIGAGAFMLDEKPELYQMLLDASQYNLRLNGAGWEGVPQLNIFAQGILPRYGIADAYSSAHVVLSSTIHSQDLYGMVNNRVFEALACGSVLVAKYSPTLHTVFGNLISYYNDSTVFHQIMQHTLSHPQEADITRKHAREFVLNGHTWDHRAIELEDFLLHLQADKVAHRYTLRPYRRNQLRMLWITSSGLKEHLDYVWMVNYHFRDILRHQFQVDDMSEDAFVLQAQALCISQGTIEQCVAWLSQYDVLFGVILPNDPLDLVLSSLPSALEVRGRLQRRAAYVLGVDLYLIERCKESHSVAHCQAMDHYDMVFFRDYFDVNILLASGMKLHELRIQHAYGIGNVILSDATPSADLFPVRPFNYPHPVVVCFHFQKDLCTVEHRLSELSSAMKRTPDSINTPPHRVILLGGKWTEWVDSGYHLFDYEMLPSITHIETTRIRTDLQDLFTNASIIVILQDYHRRMLSVQEDSIFAFVAAARKQVAVHLHSVNAHLLNLSNSDCNDWNGYKHLDMAINTGLKRMFGFAPAKANMQIDVLKLQKLSLYQVECISTNPSQDALLLQSGYVDYLLAEMEQPFAILTLSYPNYLLGRDFQLCLLRDGDTPDSMMCVMRGALYIIVVQKYPHKSSERIEYKLRGNFFGDFTFVQQLIIPEYLPPSTNKQMATMLQKQIDPKVFTFLRDNSLTFSL